MAQRKKVGIIFSNNENWIGGTYYILNLISALNTLEDVEKPEIVVFTRSISPIDNSEIENIAYPYISYNKLIDGYYDYPFIKSFINKISIRLFKRILFDERPVNIDICFPNPNHYHFEKLSQKYKVSWIPDFQEDYLPVFFSKEEVLIRKEYQRELSNTSKPVIFSSHNALMDFKRLYPNYKNTIFVLQFAVTHLSYKSLDIGHLREKHKLLGDYFFAPNQFWAHKNHIVVLKAIKKLKDEGKEFLVAFSGKQEDYRNPDYFASLQKYVVENNLQENIRFLGFIDRKEQLQLMNNALAVIQPSLFEGWSTVVEDAKAMNAHLICSDLGVHREQLNKNVDFFNPHSYQDLAEKLLKNIENKTQIENMDYSLNIKKFGKDFMEIVNKL